MGTNKGFTGQDADSLTTLDYFHARYYDPAVGVFLSADVKQGNTAGMNPYGYVGGNPETWIDPTGQMYAPPPCCGDPLPPPPTPQKHAPGHGPTGNDLCVLNPNNCGLSKLPTPPSPTKNNRLAPHFQGDSVNYVQLAGGVAELVGGMAAFFAAFGTATSNPFIFAAKWLLKNAFAGVFWLINDGLKNIRAAFPHFVPWLAVILDAIAIVVDVIQLVSNLINILDFNAFAKAATQFKEMGELINGIFQQQVVDNPGKFLAAAEDRLQSGIIGSLFGIGPLVDDIVSLQTDWQTYTASLSQ